ncbi:MAG: hypothetical protein ACR2HD_09075 [Solirubrobacteraceae bacterium]|nr:MAG: hypothetical protein DLM63_12090 [Solirubrobacterales bacterium]
MVMERHWQRLNAPRPLQRRDRRVIALLLCALVAAATVAVVLAAQPGSATRAGCIEATVAGTLGAETVHLCGSQAAQQCASAYAGAVGGQLGDRLRALCPSAGYPPPTGAGAKQLSLTPPLHKSH